jgi:serine/threonine protein kinase
MSTPALEALVGQVLDDHYHLDALLGAGGMGAVYKAEHTGLEREVAVKILHPDIGADQSISKRFDREAQSASRLDHPNCVHVTDFGTTDTGVKYLVMELLEGEELGDRLGQPWDPDDACEVLDQILAGLEHAHHHGIVHRDLKPENVFMTRSFRGEDVAKIVDFGIAKLLDADGAVEALTRAGMVFGTPRYMSPEQAAGGKIDARSDLYSVGLLAYEMLSGKPPFESDDLAAILRMQIMAPAPPLPDTVPAPLAAWVESMLEKSRNERPESAAVARIQLADIRKQIRERTPTAAEAGGLTQPAIDQLGATGAHTAMQLEAPATPELDGPLPSKHEAMIGYKVAERFHLQALLGVGGMGAVFRAQDEQTGTLVAVKVLHTALASDDEIAARFEREAQTASELEHPNIVPVFAHGTTPGTGGEAHYLVMPLLEGVELRELIGTPMDPARAGALFMQLLDALALAHAHQVVHRDLKPENVFVVRDEGGAEQIQLVDFGLAKVAEGGSSSRALTQFGQVFGTPAYMSPEQCRGEVVDARTDLYAAGIIFYELLAGRAPFEADEPLVLLGMQLHNEPPPLPEHLPPALRELVAGLLVKDREQRIPDAPTAQSALAAALAAPPAVGQPPHASASMGATMPPITVDSPVAESPASVLARLPRRWVIAGGAVLAGLLIVALWPSGSNKPNERGGTGDTPLVGSAVADPDAPKPDDEVYIEIDRLLTAKKDDDALVRIRKALDDFPNDGGLLWREAQALAMGDKAQRAVALQRYAEALAADPTLAEQTEFEAEVNSLLRDKRLRDTALDVAVRDLGSLGHSFLLERINDERLDLGYVDRHRVIEELQRDPASFARVDVRRHLALDLREAKDATNPCTAFSKALDTIADSNDPYFLDALMDRGLDVPTEPGPDESRSDCDGLDAKLAEVKGTLAAAHPDAAAKAERASKKKKKRGGGFRLPF